MAGIEQKDKRLKRGYLVALTTLIFLLGGLFFVYQGKASPAINGGGGGGGGGEIRCVITTRIDDEHVRFEYRCTTYQCGASILQREIRRTRTCQVNSCGGEDCSEWVNYDKPPSLVKTLESWLKCDLGGTVWAPRFPTYNCQGVCVEEPTEPKYNGRPTNINVDLRVLLSWNHVPGFSNIPRKGPQSYRINIDNTNAAPGETPPFSFKRGKYVQPEEERHPFQAVLGTNEFLAENCLLRPSEIIGQSSDPYNWSVQACCNLDGTNCGPKPEPLWWMTTSDKLEQLRMAPKPMDGTEQNPYYILQLEEADLRWCKHWWREGVRGRTHFFSPDRYEVDIQQRLPRALLPRLTSWRTHPLVQAMGGLILRGPNPPLIMLPPTHVRNKDFFLFTKGDHSNYKWRVRAARGGSFNQFTSYRHFLISDKVIIAPPTLLEPADDSDGSRAISWPINFRWSMSLGANSYIFELYKGNERLVRKLVESSSGEDGQITRLHGITLPKNEINFNFELDTLYKWQVQSCWDTAGRLCEKEWSKRYFKTTGRAPSLKYPRNEEKNVLIPLVLRWEEIPGATSYVINFNGVESVVAKNEVSIDLPILTQNNLYTWSVKSCNDAQGMVCGEWSEDRSFTTFTLRAPENLKPERIDYFRDKDNSVTLSWDSVIGARYYELSVICNDNIVFREIRRNNERIIPLECFGNNRWTVRACLDKDCENHGETSEGRFVLHEGTMLGTGFVPCGLDFNDPNTPWNERDSCQLNHLFIMLKIILDFVFWQLMPIILLIMTIVSGLTFYLSLGNHNIITRIKRIWSSVGKGLLVMFLGWTAITVIMTIMGYNFGIFGPWWQVSF